MPWNEVSVMDQRREFVRLALQEGANRRELCRRFGISPDVGYKWLRRWQAGDHELADQSRRPKSTPKRSVPEVEARVLTVRDKHPAWGARKIAHCLKRGGQTVPAPSTVHQILCRNERIKPSERAEFAHHAGTCAEGPIRRRGDRSHRLLHAELHRLPRANVESPPSLLRRATGRKAARPRRSLRNLLCQLAGRINRLDPQPNRQ